MSQAAVTTVINPYPSGIDNTQHFQIVAGHFVIGAGAYPSGGLPVSWADEKIKAQAPAAPPAWQASTAYAAGQQITAPTTPGYVWTCTGAGTSGSTIPTFSIAASPVTDSGATWTLTTGGPSPAFVPFVYEDSPSSNSGGAVIAATVTGGHAGTGWAVGDTGYIASNGAGGGQAATFQVLTLSGSAVATVKITNGGSNFSAAVGITAYATSGSGTGLELTIASGAVTSYSGYTYWLGTDGNLHIGASAGTVIVESSTTVPTAATEASIAFLAFFRRG